MSDARTMDFAGAIAACRQALGDEHVATGEDTLRRYQETTFATARRVPAVIRPGSTAEVQECLRIANRYGTPVYPISTGKNVGYGGRVPTSEAALVMELGRMDRIVEYNEALGYVVLQPGVTQQQLYDFLVAQGGRYWMDATGASARHSIIGNIAERGFGHTPYGDHFANACGMEVVLPTGDLVHTGFGRFPNAKARYTYRWGVGPYIDGLFTQSNLGVITELTVWLMPVPEYTQSFYFSVDRHEQLAEVIELLRPLRLDGTLRSAMHIGNDYKVLSSIQLYPWKETGGETPLRREVLERFAKSWDFGAWNASGALYGTRQEVASARKRLKTVLKGRVKKLRFLDDRLLALAVTLQKPYQWITGMNLPEMLKIIKPVYGMTKGVPTEDMIPSTYWRKRDPAPADPDPERDGCGLMWLAPIAPTNGAQALEVADITSEVISRHGFEPAISITMITERATDSVISIGYDRGTPGEDERAMACHDELLARLTDAGYYPYRLGVQSQGKLPEAEPGYRLFLSRVKQALDPNGILAPGRYDA